jgi:hypothetical protein
MDGEESTKTNATAFQGARFRALLSIHAPAEGRRPPETLSVIFVAPVLKLRVLCSLGLSVPTLYVQLE